MVYKGLVADNVPGVPETLFEEIDRKVSFPGGVFSEYPVDEGNYVHSVVSMRKEIQDEIDEIHAERAAYLLNTDDALIEMYS